MNPRLALVLLPLLLYFAGYAAFTAPALLSMGSQYFSDSGDGWQNVWNIWWMRKALLEQHTHPWWTDQVFHPQGVTLVAQTMNPINGLLALPLQPLLGPVATFNTLIVFAFVTGGWFAFLLAWHFTRHLAGSLFAGAAFTFSHYHFAHAPYQMQLTTLQYVPLFLLAWVRVLERPSAARAALAGGAFVLVWLSDLYYVMYSVLFASVLFVREAFVRRAPWFFVAPPWRRALLVFLPFVFATAGVHGALLVHQDRTDPLTGVHDPLDYSADFASAFVPSTAWRFCDDRLYALLASWGDVAEKEVYLGWSVLLLAAVGVWRGTAAARRVWLLLAGLAFVLSLGPVVRVCGHPVWTLGTPYQVLEVLFPPIALSGCPARFAMMTSLALGLLAAWGVASLRGRWRWLLAPLLVLFTVEVLPLPLEPPRTSKIEPDEVITALGGLPPGAVHEAEVDYWILMGRQTLHGRPMPEGYVSRLPLSRYRQREYLSRVKDEQRWAEMMRRLDVRYLVLPNARVGHHTARELVAIHSGTADTIFVLPEDPLAAGKGPVVTIACRDTGPGAVEVTLQAPHLAGLPYVCGFSFSRASDVPLAADKLLHASVDPEDPRFFGTLGRVPADGRIRVHARLGPDRSRWPVFFALLVFDDPSEPKRSRVAASGSWLLW